MAHKHTSRGRGHWLLPRLVLAAALLLPLAGCDTDGILEVEDPDVTLPAALFDPANLPALRATVVGDFAVAFGGSSATGTPGTVHASGLLADEFWHSGTFGQNRELDRRQIAITNSLVQNMTRNLHRSRRSAMLGLASYAQNQPNTAAHAEMVNYEGYIYVFLAENFCSGVPFSEEVDGRFEYGQGEPTENIFNRALASFDRALQIATAAGTGAPAVAQQRLAIMGRARVLMDLNRYAEAAALVRDIPTTWSYDVQYSDNTGRQNNGVWGNNHGRREIAMSSREGGNGVEFRKGTATTQNTTVNVDPRVPWSFRNGAADTRSVHHFQLKYPTQNAPIQLASGIQARLIEAEAALARGQSDAYLPILNALRGTINLPALADPGTPAARVDQFFEERALWLYATANRLSDLRRLVRQYGRNTEAVFPTGVYFRPGLDGPRQDGVYGTDVNFPITFDEQNNPQFQQCIDRNA
ncbi:MAG: hypothetical protein M3418_10280 [Gemmatimonadota bacterium]|nr:hypothetical protein [Gemmatimonadota bacterium]